MAKSQASIVTAVQAVFEALDGLAPNERERVLASVRALLGLSETTPHAPLPAPPQPSEAQPLGSRPKSLIELIQEKRPHTNPERIALFAYYREKYERLSRFSRGELVGYFSKAKEPPPANFDRDFTNAVKSGWIHEDGAESYLTSKGVEAVESSFSGAGEPSPTKRKGSKKGARKKSKKKTKR
jgi:hypothetical protein